MEADAGTPVQQSPQLHGAVPSVLRRRILRRNWVISFLLALLAILFVIHVSSLRRSPRPKASSVWDAVGKTRLSAGDLPEVTMGHTNITDNTVLGFKLDDLLGSEVRSHVTHSWASCV